MAQDNFDISRFLKNNPLLNEEMKTQPGGAPPDDAGFDWDDDDYDDPYDDERNEFPFDPNKDDDYDKNNDVPVTEEDEDEEEGEESMYAGQIFDMGGDVVEQGIISLLDKDFSPEEIKEFVEEILENHLSAKAQGKQF